MNTFTDNVLNKISSMPVASNSSQSSISENSSACDTGLWNYVYNPQRLQVKNACATVSGTIEVIRSEKDGDKHILLKVADASLLNQANIDQQQGDLVLELVCVGTVTQADAMDACNGFTNNITIPAIGETVTVTGSYVLDTEHGWMEIHPVSNIVVLHH